MKKIAVVYWSGGGNTEAMAKAAVEGARKAGGDAALVPRYAATMGMAPILAAKKCLLLACFAEQTAPLNAIIARNGEPTPFLPASYLWRHPDFRLIYTTDKIDLRCG